MQIINLIVKNVTMIVNLAMDKILIIVWVVIQESFWIIYLNASYLVHLITIIMKIKWQKNVKFVIKIAINALISLNFVQNVTMASTYTKMHV